MTCLVLVSPATRQLISDNLTSQAHIACLLRDTTKVHQQLAINAFQHAPLAHLFMFVSPVQPDIFSEVTTCATLSA